MWAIEHYEGVEPDLLVSGKSIGGGLPLAGVTGRGEIMDAVPPGGLGGTFGGNPLSCAAAAVVLDTVSDEDVPRAGARARATRSAPGSTTSPRVTTTSARCGASGRCSRSSSRSARADRASTVVAAAFERGARPPLLRPVRERHPAAPTADDRSARSSTRVSRSWRSRLQLDGVPDIRVTGLTQALRRGHRRRRDRPRDRPRRVLHPARPVRVGEDDDAADGRGLRAAGRRQHPARRRGRVAAPAVRAAREHRVPGLRALPAHDGAAERRVRADGEEGEEGRAACASRRARSRWCAWAGTVAASRRSSRAASASASRSRARSSTSRRCSSSTSRSARST